MIDTIKVSVDPKPKKKKRKSKNKTINGIKKLFKTFLSKPAKKSKNVKKSKKNPKPSIVDNEQRTIQSAALMQKKRESVREVGEIPPVENPDRRASCEEDLGKFLKTYMPVDFYLPWSSDHVKVLAKLQRAILKGGQFAEAMPRADGKTTILRGAAVWAILYGHRRFIPIIGAESQHAKKILEAITVEITTNDLLCADFPEVAIPARHIDGIGQRAAGQLHEGKRTYIKWNKELIVFPTIPGSKCSGSIIAPRGITGSIRGMHHKTSTGETIRPDFVLIDDPQTEESAKSATQCKEREQLIDKAILGLAGPDKRIAALMAVTIIQKGDLADCYLDHKKHPEWQGECMKMVYTWPDTQKTLWSEYAEMRKDGLLKGDQGKEATEFYKQNREKMDAGAEVAWPQRFYEDELSALQHAENLLIDRGQYAFMSEYQNSPQDAHPALYKITAEIVIQKINTIPIYHAPDHAVWIVGMMDLNPAYGIHYCLTWIARDLTGGILDYGKYPEAESVPLVDKDNLQGISEKQIIFTGLHQLCGLLHKKQIMRAGMEVPIDLLMIDCGHEMQLVFQFVNARQKTWGGINHLVCSRGRDAMRYKQYKAVRTGDNLHLAEWVGKGKVIVHNADYWRVYTQKSFLLPVDAPGSLSIYGEKSSIHSKFSRHIASEQLVEFREGDVADYYNWHMQPGERNDLLDCMVGCCVAGSYCGADPNINQMPAVRSQQQGQATPTGRPRYQHFEI